MLPWSFWKAESTESAAVTVPDPATKLVRRDEREIFELKVFQSVPVRRPVDDEVALPIAIETFGQTVEFVPLVMVIAEFAVVKLPNVSADCLLLNMFQSVAVRAPVVVALAVPIENTPVVLL